MQMFFSLNMITEVAIEQEITLDNKMILIASLAPVALGMVLCSLFKICKAFIEYKKTGPYEKEIEVN